MGCSTCGQKYPGARNHMRRFQRSNIVQKSKAKPVMSNVKNPLFSEQSQAETPKVVDQEQPKEGTPGTAPTENCDPTTGQEIAVIKTGSEGETLIPDNTLQPDSLEVTVVADIPKGVSEN